MHYFLDEMYSAIVAEAVSRSGIAAESAHLTGHEGMPDEQIPLMAGERGWCVVTANYRDVLRISREFTDAALPHAGIVILPPHIGHRAHGLIARSLVAFARQQPDGLQPSEVQWLPIVYDTHD